MIKPFLALLFCVLPGMALADKYPTIFYLSSRPDIQVGVVRNFDDNRIQVLHDNIRDPGVMAAVHPESGRYVLNLRTSGFEHFDFGDTGRYFIFGTITKGAIGWTVPETNMKSSDFTESEPRFSQDGARFYSTLRYKNNSVISVYEFQTGASERIFYNRWPRVFYRGIPIAVISKDERKAVFAAARGRRIELNTWPVQSVTNESPSLVFKLRDIPSELFAGKNLLVYKTTRYLKRKMKKTVLSFYDTKISENYNVFSYSETPQSANVPNQAFVVDDKTKMLYTVDRPEGKSGVIYRVNLHTLKVDSFYPNALRIFDISRDGRYLLYTRYRDESKLAGNAEGWKEDPQTIAVLDVQTKETFRMEIPGALSFSYLAFTYN